MYNNLSKVINTKKLENLVIGQIKEQGFGKMKFDQVNFDKTSYDKFAIGATMVRILFGDDLIPQGNKMDYEAVQSLVEFYRSGNQAIGGPNSPRPSTGNLVLDRLINDLLSTDPNQRPSLDTLLDSQAFNDPRIGSQAVRELAFAIAKKDDNEIQLAANNVN